MEWERLEGYVVDMAYLRKYPREQWLERARAHPTSCAPTGHCIESGYALISKAGAAHDRGLRLRADRELEDQEMRTKHVTQL